MVDTELMQLSIPRDKVNKALDLIDLYLTKKSITLRQLQSITGLLAFFTRALPGGRTFIRRLYNLTIGVQDPSHHIRLKAPARADLKMWQVFLKHFNGASLISHVFWSESPDYRVYSDASGTAYAGVYGNQWFAGKFPPEWLNMSIAVKEMVPIYIAINCWISRLCNSTIVFYTDNESVMHILQSLTSSDPVIMKMIRQMVIVAMLNNVVFYSKHIPGRYNVISDALSHFQWQRAREWAPWLSLKPEQPPAECFPWHVFPVC